MGRVARPLHSHLGARDGRRERRRRIDGNAKGAYRMNRDRSVQASMFGCNSYSYMRSHSAEACLARLADLSGYVVKTTQ